MIFKKKIGFEIKMRDLSTDFVWTFIENTQISNFMKIRPVEQSCSMLKDGYTEKRADMTKLAVAFRNFCERD
jgi:hypothetical protein